MRNLGSTANLFISNALLVYVGFLFRCYPDPYIETAGKKYEYQPSASQPTLEARTDLKEMVWRRHSGSFIRRNSDHNLV